MSRKMTQKVLSGHTRISKKYQKKERQKKNIYSQKHVRHKEVLLNKKKSNNAILNKKQSNNKNFNNKKQSIKKLIKRRAESPLILTQHGKTRMADRHISLNELQMTKKYGQVCRSHNKGSQARWKIQYENIVYMTDRTLNTVITTYKLPSSSWKNNNQNLNCKKHKKEDRRTISAKKQLNKEAIYNQMLLNII
jgi:hypothetical protein